MFLHNVGNAAAYVVPGLTAGLNQDGGRRGRSGRSMS